MEFKSLYNKTSKRQYEAINFTIERIEKHMSISQWEENNEFISNSRFCSDEIQLKTRIECTPAVNARKDDITVMSRLHSKFKRELLENAINNPDILS